jgi:hypothetical protein
MTKEKQKLKSKKGGEAVSLFDVFDFGLSLDI